MVQVPVPTCDEGLDVDALEVMLQQQQCHRCGWEHLAAQQQLTATVHNTQSSRWVVRP
jgi:hypothetical protein